MSLKVRLSILMPSYNHAPFLEKRIPSVLEQLSPEDELIFVDDASTDGSFSIAEAIAKTDPRLVLIKNEKNQGPSRSANIALEASKGEYFAWLGADDFLLPGFIEKTMEVLEKNPHIGIACSDCVLSIEEKVTSHSLVPGISSPTLFPKAAVLRLFQKTAFWVPGHTSIMRKDRALECGGFELSLGPHSDWFLVHAIALQHGVAYLPFSLSIWRRDDHTYSSRVQQNREESFQCKIAALEFLKRKEHKEMKRRFQRSGVLRLMIRPRLFRLFFYPRYWEFLFFFFQRALFNRSRKYFFRKFRHLDLHPKK